jgi:hypothetical protein
MPASRNRGRHASAAMALMSKPRLAAIFRFPRDDGFEPQHVARFSAWAEIDLPRSLSKKRRKAYARVPGSLKGAAHAFHTLGCSRATGEPPIGTRARHASGGGSVRGPQIWAKEGQMWPHCTHNRGVRAVIGAVLNLPETDECQAVLPDVR